MVLNVGLLGLGTVGAATAEILLDPQQRQPLLREIAIKRVGVRSLSKSRSTALADLAISDDLEAIVTDPEIDLVVEAIGGLEPARSAILQAIACNKHVVTANKAVIARYGDEIFAAARAAGVYVAIEAAVGGGIPIIRPLQQALSVNRLKRLLGIVNGTTNYILTQMSQHGADFAAVLAEAQRLGYAEADPTADIEGYDAADKVAILAALAFGGRVDLAEVHREGITQVSAADIRYADRLGFEIKLLAVAARDGEALQVRVHPTLVPRSHPLASVSGVNNAIFVEGDPLGEVMFFGPGAGGGATASAVVSDILNIAAQLKLGDKPNPLALVGGGKPQAVAPIADLTTRFYARSICSDRPGVIGYLGTCFGKHDVSLESIVQIDFKDGLAEIVVVTHNVREGNFRQALDEILSNGDFGEVRIPSVLRVL